MTLTIRPIRLKRSVYVRVPNDIVDLINLEDNSQVTLTIEEKNDRTLLVYSVLKTRPSEDGPLPLPQPASLVQAMQQSSGRSRRVERIN